MAGKHQLVHPRGINCHLRRRAVPSIAEHLDHDRCPSEVEVDADELVAAAGTNLLRGWTGERGRRNEAEVLALEPTVPAACNLAAFDGRQQSRNSVAPFAAQVRDPLMQEALDHQAVADGAVERGRQPIGSGIDSEVDEGARRREHRESVHLLAVDRWKVFGRVHNVADAMDEAAARYDEMKRRFQLEAVEAMKRGRRAAEQVHRLADGVEQFLQLVEVGMLEAALVPASRTR